MKIARHIICVRFNDATPVDRSKVAVNPVGIEMCKIAFLICFRLILSLVDDKIQNCEKWSLTSGNVID